MAKVIYAARALSDLVRLSDFLQQSDPAAAAGTVALIIEAVGVLENHPLIGRPSDAGLRELVISRGKSGYVAKYSHEPEHDMVLVLAVRHQRESGMTPE